MFDLIKLLSPFFLKQWKRLTLFAILTPLIFSLDAAILFFGGALLNGELRAQSIFLLVAAFFLAEGLRHGQKFLLTLATLAVAVSLQNKLVQKILRAPFAAFSSMTSGGKSKRIFRDADQVASFTESLASLFFREPLRVLFFSVLLFLLSPLLFLVLALSLFFVGGASWWIGAQLSLVYEKGNEQESALFQRLQKLLSSWHWIKATQMEEKESARWERGTCEYYCLQQRAALLNLIYPIAFRLLLIGVGLVVWSLYVAGLFPSFKTMSDWVYPVGLALLWVQSIKEVASSCVGLIDEGIRAKQLAQILKWPNETEPIKPHTGEPALTQLSLQEIYFGYEKGREFFNGLSLDLRSGDVLVISGPNGCGKTTLTYLLIGFLSPQRGKIWHNARLAEESSVAWLRRRSGILFQHPHLLEETLTENLFYGLNGHSREGALAALDLVGLAHLVRLEKEGELLGETLRELSFGEKQKLALARVFLQNPDLLILDEATSGLDPESEEKILRELFLKRKEKITLVVTHKWRSQMPVRHLRL